jgi:hypothetical protein
MRNTKWTPRWWKLSWKQAAGLAALGGWALLLAQLTHERPLASRVATTPKVRRPASDDSSRFADIEMLAKIEAHQRGIFGIVSAEQDPVAMVAKIDAALNSFHSFVRGQSDVSLARLATRSYLRTLKLLERWDLTWQLAPPLVNRAFTSCVGFSDCSFVIVDLADLADSAPTAALDALKMLRANIQGLSGRLTEREAVPMASSLPQRLLEYRLDVLQINLTMRDSFWRRNRGSPGLAMMLAEDVEVQTQRMFEDLDYQYEKLFPEPKKLFESHEAYMERVESFVTELRGDLYGQLLATGGASAENSVFDQLSSDFLSAMLRTRQQSAALQLYFTRLKVSDFGPLAAKWLQRADLGEIDPETLALVASQFAEFEVLGPERRAWSNFLSQSIAKVSGETRPVWDLVLKSLLERQSQIEKTLSEFYVQSGFDETPGSLKEPLVATLVRDEVSIVRGARFFRSLWYQKHRLEEAQLALGQVAAQIKDGKPTEEQALGLSAAIDHVAVRWLNIACNAMAFSKNVKAEPRVSRGRVFMAVSVPVYDEGKFSQAQACKRDGNKDFESAASRLVLDRRISAVWRPFYWQVGISVITLPIMVVSAGSANAVTLPLTALVTRVGTAAAARYVMGRMGTMALTVLMPRLTGAIAGSIVFSAVNRLLLSAVTLGTIPLYEASKGLWGNYGKELVFGSVVFYFLPYATMLSQSMVQRLSKVPSLASNPRLIALTELGVKTGTETAFFVPVTYVDRVVSRITGESKDPVFRGWGDLAGNVAHSMTAVLTFRLHELHLRRVAADRTRPR